MFLIWPATTQSKDADFLAKIAGKWEVSTSDRGMFHEKELPSGNDEHSYGK